jgi:hypothetical protein
MFFYIEHLKPHYLVYDKWGQCKRYQNERSGVIYSIIKTHFLNSKPSDAQSHAKGI